MNYEKFKTEIKEIAEISQSVPQPFREKCFEVLLTHLIGINQPTPPKKEDATPLKDKFTNRETPSALRVPANVMAFMRRTSVTQQELEAIVMVVDGELHFIKEPSHGQAAKGQNEWALLVALKNGILNNNLVADPEEVRSIVQAKGFYDNANFATNFRKPKYARLFRNALEPQGTAQPISRDGEQELAALIKSLAT